MCIRDSIALDRNDDALSFFKMASSCVQTIKLPSRPELMYSQLELERYRHHIHSRDTKAVCQEEGHYESPAILFDKMFPGNDPTEQTPIAAPFIELVEMLPPSSLCRWSCES